MSLSGKQAGIRYLALILLLAGCQAAAPPPPQTAPVVLPPPPPVPSRKVISGLVITDEVVEAMAAYFGFAFHQAERLRLEGKHPLPSAVYLSLPGKTDPDDELLVMLADFHADYPGPPYRRVLPLSEQPWQSPEIAWTIYLERMEWMGSEDDIRFLGGLNESHQRFQAAWSPEFVLTTGGRWVLKRSN